MAIFVRHTALLMLLHPPCLHVPIVLVIGLCQLNLAIIMIEQIDAPAEKEVPGDFVSGPSFRPSSFCAISVSAIDKRWTQLLGSGATFLLDS